MKYEVWTFFIGNQEDAKELVAEWNDVSKSTSFHAVPYDSKNNVYRIEGEVEQWVIDDTSISSEFVIEY